MSAKVAANAASLFSLGGKCALVTGAGTGIGRAIAKALASAGADVVCVGRREAELKDTVKSIESMGRRAWALPADLSEIESVPAIAERARDAAGAVDILVNNAGTIRRYPAAEYPRAEWDAVMELNVDAVFALSQRVGRAMIERGSGKIINIASLLSFSGGITVPAYTASKHAVAGLTKALANEWARFGVNVNAIAPGYVNTANTKALREDEKRRTEITARIPAGRWGEPDDLGGAAIFLASAASDYVNGHVLVVDGGWMAR
jgi:2-deoxy-D-gluconate 3-dehydrogenase